MDQNSSHTADQRRRADHMVTRRQASAGVLSAAVLAGTSGVRAQAATIMQLPPPRPEGGKPLIQALKLRRSIREYADRALPLQVLSDLLWAAFGVNRPSGDRTAPYWRHVMVIDVYAVMANGVWFYDPKGHFLQQHSRVDMQDVSPVDRRLYASVDAGFIGQNVYLFCASEGLATVFRGAVDTKKLAQAMELDSAQFVTFAQTVGYPKA
jgi:nitroreductase family protein